MPQPGFDAVGDDGLPVRLTAVNDNGLRSATARKRHPKKAICCRQFMRLVRERFFTPRGLLTSSVIELLQIKQTSLESHNPKNSSRHSAPHCRNTIYCNGYFK